LTAECGEIEEVVIASGGLSATAVARVRVIDGVPLSEEAAEAVKIEGLFAL
jgi:hypothetical protein